MARSIVAALHRIKCDLAEFLRPQLIETVCSAVEHVWRDRILGPVTTIHLFCLQILNNNAPCSQVPRLGAVDCSAEAYCQARLRLPLSVLKTLLKLLTQSLHNSTKLDEGRWHGHRTFLLDGSSVSMPDTPELQEAFGQPGAQKKGCGFPVAHLLAMFHAGTGYLLDVLLAPLRTHDMSQVEQLHPELGPGDILVGDRAFSSFAHFALLAARGVLGVFRAHQKQKVDFTPHRPHATRHTRKRKIKDLPTSRWVKRLGRRDQLVDYVKPACRPRWMTAQEYQTLPETIRIRELSYQLPKAGYRTRQIVIATTLLDPACYPAKDIAALYGQRWTIELNFRHLKTTMKMDVLRCKTVEGVQKELMMYAIVYNLIRQVMLKAAKLQNVPVDRISFVDAARWLADAVYATPALKLRIVPLRPGRSEPRAVKRRPKAYDQLNRPRQEARKRLERKGVAA